MIMILFSFNIGIEFESRKLELFVSKLKITLKTEMKIRQFNFRFWTFQNNKFETKTSILQIVELISKFKLVFTLSKYFCWNVLSKSNIFFLLSLNIMGVYLLHHNTLYPKNIPLFTKKKWIIFYIFLKLHPSKMAKKCNIFYSRVVLPYFQSKISVFKMTLLKMFLKD